MDEDVDGIVSAVARHIRPDLDQLTRSLADLFLEVIPEFHHDDAVKQLMISSTAANLAEMVDMLDHGIRPDHIGVPPAAAEYARRFAQLDLSLEALLRAYRLGENRFLRWAVGVLGGLDLDTRQALDAASELSARANRYIDQVIEGLVDIYEDEHRQWNARSDAVRAATIRAVLDSAELDVGTAEATLGAPLRGWHRAAVFWGASDATALEDLQRGLGEVTGLAPLSVVAEPGCLWAWWSATTSPAVAPKSFDRLRERHPDLCVALGTAGTGLAGFRTSHHEAQRARALVLGREDRRCGPRGWVTDYDDVALAAMLAAQPVALRAWVARTLGDLARDDSGVERLRETLRAYLAADRSSSGAAARLHLHKNTVHYRLHRAEELLGRPLADARLDIEVALLACHHLGEDVLTR
jgi:DNA-binding PucR family transcriptional regulator